MTRELVYGRRPVREALRGPREVLELWAGERAVKSEPWLRETRAAARPGQAGARALGGGGDARPPGRRRLVRALPLRRRVRARGRRGAAARLPRPGQRPAQPRRGHPLRRRRGRDRRRRPGARLGARDRRRLPRLGGRGRAPAGRRRHEPGALSDGDQARRPLDRRRGRRDGDADVAGRPRGRRRFVFGAEGKGLRPLVRRACDVQVSIPLARPRRVAERQRRGRAPPLRGRARQQRWLSRRCTCSTATTSCTRAASARRGAARPLASLVAAQGARGVLVFDGVGGGRERGPLEVRCAPDADTLLERLAAEHRDREQVALVSSDPPSAARPAVEVRKLASQTFLARARADRAHAAEPRAATCGTASTPRRGAARAPPPRQELSERTVRSHSWAPLQVDL